MPSVAPSISSLRATPAPPSYPDPTSGTTDSGGFQDYMSAYAAQDNAPPKPSQASPPARAASSTSDANSTANTTSTANATSTPAPADTTSSSDVTTALKKLGLSQSDIATVLTDLQKGDVGAAKAIIKAAKTGSTDTTSDSTTQTGDTSAAAALANGVAVPVATQPTLALGFDPVSIATAAEQAIAALTGQSTATTPATATAAAQTTAATTAADAASAQLAQQGVVSITGQVTGQSSTAQVLAVGAAATLAAGAHTIANQSGSPALTDAGQAAADVAAAAIKQANGNVPMSRMAEIRSKLQAAQLGAAKTTGLKSDTSASGTTSAAGIETAVTGETAAANATLTQLSQKFVDAATAQQDSLGQAADQKNTDADVSTDPSLTTSANLVDPSLGGVNQAQTQQPPVQQAASALAVPLSAVAGTIVAQAKAGSSEFNIRLDPGGLGQIDVKLKVSSDGEVRAHLIVDQPATLDLMMRDKQQLQQSLDQAGFKTDSSSLQFSLRDQGQGQNQGQQQASQGQSSQTNAQTTPDTLTPLQSAVYSRQSYVRADGVDLSV